MMESRPHFLIRSSPRATRLLVIAFGLSTLGCIPLLVPLISPSHLAVYHLQGSASSLFLPPLLYFASSWILLTAAVCLGERFWRFRLVFWSVALCLAPLLILLNCIALLGTNVPPFCKLLVLAVALCGTLAAAVTQGHAQDARMRTAIRVAELASGFVACTGVLFIGQLLWCFHEAAGPRRDQKSRIDRLAMVQSKPSRPRIIWIVLDELSYRQVYGRRFPGLQLDGFDRLSAESVVLTHVKPAGFFTENVIPSLLTATPVERVSASADGRELTLFRQTGGRELFNQNDTVFSDALTMGYRAGVVGWYIPYCRILSNVLDRCTWVTIHGRMPGGFLPNAPFRANISAPFSSAWRTLAWKIRPNQRTLWTDRELNRLHISEFQRLASEADSLLQDPSTNFILVHMPVPHPNGIYNRGTQEFTSDGNSSYLDNLALANTFLVHIEDMLTRRKEWTSSAVVLMGDHSWRPDLWRAFPGWTAEDEAASDGGGFDDRPAYVVKLPGERIATNIDTPFDAIRTRSLLNGIMHGQIRSTAELSTWITTINSTSNSSMPGGRSTHP